MDTIFAQRMVLDVIIRKLKDKDPNSKLAGSLSKNSETIKYISTIIIASAGTVAAAAGYADYLGPGESANHVAGVTTLLEFGVYTGIFVPLFYARRSDKYKNEDTKKVDLKLFAKDIGKIGLSAIATGLVFYPSSFYFSKTLLESDFSPASAITYSYFGALTLSTVFSIFLLKKTKVLNNKTESGEVIEEDKKLLSYVIAPTREATKEGSINIEEIIKAIECTEDVQFVREPDTNKRSVQVQYSGEVAELREILGYDKKQVHIEQAIDHEIREG